MISIDNIFIEVFSIVDLLSNFGAVTRQFILYGIL